MSGCDLEKEPLRELSSLRNEVLEDRLPDTVGLRAPLVECAPWSVCAGVLNCIPKGPGCPCSLASGWQAPLGLI